MKEALKLATKAAELGEVPVGAVIVNPLEKKIIAKAANDCESERNPLRHAEIIAINKACETIGSKTLKGCYIYVTLEPCVMCAAAISYARLSRIYYGASDKKFGAIENGSRLFSKSSCLFKPEIYGGILAEESEEILKGFFASIRKN
ncbi:MAG: nucleoside deaminase [Rickettsiales bacterium]|nr:nucleoside deaminase [Rickettsiales bacterium]